MSARSVAQVTNIGNAGRLACVCLGMERLDDQHAAWLARTFGRTDYLPLTREDATALSQAGSIIDKYKGTHLFREGESSDAAFVIQEGDVELYRMGSSGRTVVGRLGPGAVVGDIAMFQEEPYLSSARAVTGVRALRLEKETLFPLLLARPVIAMRWLVTGLGQLEATQRSLIRLMNRTVLEQVADLLLEEQDRYGEVRLAQSTIAELLGASRQSVNEALGRLKEGGVIDTGYRRISVMDTAGLTAATSA